MAIITRIGFCPQCEQSHDPKGGQLFLAYGSSTKRYHILTAQNNGVIGYTPHIYKLDKEIGGNCIVYISCAMYPCGVKREWVQSYYLYTIRSWRREIWSFKKWEALVKLKHNQFTQMYEI